MSEKTLSVSGRIHTKFKILSAAFSCFFGITMFFVFSDIMTNFLGSFLRVDPSYTGGEVCGEFVGNNIFSDTKSDLVHYTVHQPVTNARWQRSAEYWQLVLEYKNAESASEDFKIYIGLDNQKSYDELWDFVVQLTKGEGKVFDRDGNFITAVEYYLLNEGTQIKFRIPLSDKRLQKVLGAKKTYHYIVADEFSKDMTPLEVTMTPRKKDKKAEAETKAFVKHVKEVYNQTRSAEGVPEAAASDNKPDANDIEACLLYYGQKIKDNPEDYVNLSNYGAYLAMKGGRSSIMKATALVKESYTYLDKACALAFEKNGEIDVLLNRGSVSASVPEQVFGKAESGAEDFMRIILLSEDKNLKAYCYVMAYECYKKRGNESKAFLALQEAKNMIE